jgi:hypothetical protein
MSDIRSYSCTSGILPSVPCPGEKQLSSTYTFLDYILSPIYSSPSNVSFLTKILSNLLIGTQVP